MKYCPVCNRTYDSADDVKFCESCGVAVVEKTEVPAAPEKKNNSKIIIIVLSVLLAIAVAAVVFFVAKGSFAEKNKAPAEDNLMVEEVSSVASSSVPETTTVPEKLTANVTTTVPQTTTEIYMPSNIIEIMSDSEITALNTFLSNFAEVRFEDYNSSYPDDAQLIDFAIKHAYINNNSSIVSQDGASYMSKEYADKYISRFFGKSVSYRDTSLVAYNPDSETLSASTTNLHFGCIEYSEEMEYRQSFASAYDVKKNNDGTYTVQFNILSVDIDKHDISGFYSKSCDDLQNHSGVKKEADCIATVRVSGNDIDDSFSYQLLTYDVTFR